MITTITKGLTLNHFGKAISTNDDEVIIQAWELHHMNRVLSELDLVGYKPPPDDPDPPVWPFPPLPWPFSVYLDTTHVLDLIENLDPTPETSHVLNGDLRRKAAKNILLKLKDATATLEKQLNL